MTDPVYETENRRARRAADAAAERARNPHSAIIVCDRCSATHVVEDAEKHTDESLAVQFHMAGWDLRRGYLCPTHKALNEPLTAGRSRAQRERRAGR